MFALAAVGVVANVVGLLVLREGAKESLNHKGAYLEVFGDLLGSVSVIIAAVVIATGPGRRSVTGLGSETRGSARAGCRCCESRYRRGRER